jgi:hypothetical protein
MQPENIRFGGGAAETMLNPLAAVLMVIAIVLILSQPRNKAITPFLLTFFTIPAGQVVVVGGLHFTVLRILTLAVLARMVAFRGRCSEGKLAGGFNRLDRVVVLWTLSTFIVFYLEFLETQVLIKGLGDLIDSLGGYLAVRFLIPDRETLRRSVKALAAICVIQGVCMCSELFTFQNVFGSMGANQPSIREGRVRAEGTMGGLYAGAFAGVLIPVFLWICRERKYRLVSGAGLAGATAMVLASHASTAWLAYAGSLVGLAFWPLRKHMRLVRWAIVTTLVSLHLVMNGPVWSLIEHIDLTGGSSSYHRYMLVDNCIRHVADWWLLGCKNYGDWGFSMWDLCNQFVVAAVTGGVVTLIIFIAVYSRGFGAVGIARRRVNGDRVQEWSVWCLGSALFANVVASFGINYMNHLMMSFYVLLVCISVSTLALRPPDRQHFQRPPNRAEEHGSSDSHDLIREHLELLT